MPNKRIPFKHADSIVLRINTLFISCSKPCRCERLQYSSFAEKEMRLDTWFEYFTEGRPKEKKKAGSFFKSIYGNHIFYNVT